MGGDRRPFGQGLPRRPRQPPFVQAHVEVGVDDVVAGRLVLRRKKEVVASRLLHVAAVPGLLAPVGVTPGRGLPPRQTPISVYTQVRRPANAAALAEQVAVSTPAVAPRPAKIVPRPTGPAAPTPVDGVAVAPLPVPAHVRPRDTPAPAPTVRGTVVGLRPRPRRLLAKVAVGLAPPPVRPEMSPEAGHETRPVAPRRPRPPRLAAVVAGPS